MRAGVVYSTTNTPISHPFRPLVTVCALRQYHLKNPLKNDAFSFASGAPNSKLIRRPIHQHTAIMSAQNIGDNNDFLQSTLDLFTVWLEDNCIDMTTAKQFIKLIKQASVARTVLINGDECNVNNFG